MVMAASLNNGSNVSNKRRLLLALSIFACCGPMSVALASFGLPSNNAVTTREQQQQPTTTTGNVAATLARRQPRTTTTSRLNASISGRPSSSASSSLSLPGRRGVAGIEKLFSSKKGLAIALALSSFALSQKLHVVTSALSNLLASYESSLVVRPLRTKVLTGASLAVLGDSLAQQATGGGTKSGGYDVPRAASFAAFDACYRLFQHVAIPAIVALGTGRTLGGLVTMIASLGGLGLGGSESSIALFAAMERTFLYQFGLIPFFYYPVFFTFTGFMQGLSPRETLQRARTSFLPCWKRNLMFWIPIQMVMFGLVDEKWQIPFVCVMGIIWSSILSITAGKAK